MGRSMNLWKRVCEVSLWVTVVLMFLRQFGAAVLVLVLMLELVLELVLRLGGEVRDWRGVEGMLGRREVSSCCFDIVCEVYLQKHE